MFESFELYLQRKMKLLLLKPFHYWRAYQLGIIDENGNKLREPNSSEREVYNVFDELIRKIKITFMKYVPNKGIIRHKVFKEFLTDGFIEALDESCNYSSNIVTETTVPVEGIVLNWLIEKKYQKG